MSKIFFRNFIVSILIFLAFTFLLGYVPGDDGQGSIGFLSAYIMTSACCVLYLGGIIGQRYVEYEMITEKTRKFLVKEKITIEEFRKKYRDIIAIYDKSTGIRNDIE